jgi:hypothetical protein
MSDDDEGDDNSTVCLHCGRTLPDHKDDCPYG